MAHGNGGGGGGFVVAHVLFLDGKKLSGLAVATTDRLAPKQRVYLLATHAGIGAPPKHLRCAVTVVKRLLP